jgi:outer membrane immunogenic protein
MRRIAFGLLATAGLSTGMALSASAADMPVKAAPMPVVVAAADNWTGWYMGLNAGGNWGTSQPSTTATRGTYFVPRDLAQIAAAGNQSFKTNGFTGGIQGGYNWQSGYLLAGIELDFGYFDSSGSQRVTAAYLSAPGSALNVNTSVSTNWLFTARPRLGVVANNVLFYGTGGLALTQLKASWAFTDTYASAAESASASSTKAGWAVGGGIEAAMSGNWSIGGEYLYVKFGGVSAVSSNLTTTCCGGGAVFSHSADLASSIFRVRLNKKF